MPLAVETKGARTDAHDRFVMEPSALTRFLLLHLRVQSGAVALDLGCGSGALSVAAVERGASRCWAIDLNADAVYETHRLAVKSGMAHRVLPIVADISEVDRMIPEPIDLVIANPPQLPTSDSVAQGSTNRNLAYDGGPDGRKLLDLMIVKAAAVLRNSKSETPELYFVTTSVVGIGATFRTLQTVGFHTEVIAQRQESFRPVYLERVAAMRKENYSIHGGAYYETLYVLRSRLRP